MPGLGYGAAIFWLIVAPDELPLSQTEDVPSEVLCGESDQASLTGGVQGNGHSALCERRHVCVGVLQPGRRQGGRVGQTAPRGGGRGTSTR